MEFEKLKVNLTINNSEYLFYYSCNKDTTFNDLLEYFSYLVPNLNICKCYQFQASKDKKNSKEQRFSIPHQSKVEEYKKYLKDIIIVKSQDNCHHNNCNLLLSSKNDIICNYQNIISKLNKEIEKYKKYIDAFKKELKKYILIPKPIIGSQIDFYDVIVHINSVKDINKGWKIQMNERGKRNYEKYKNEKVNHIFFLKYLK